MKYFFLALSMVTACSVLSTSAQADNMALGTSANAEQIASKAKNEKQQRAELTYQIVKKWGGHVQEAYRTSPKKWAMDMLPLFRASSMDAMLGAANARTFNAMNDALLQNNSRSGKKISTTKALGDLANDLVYVPIAPCRIFDTRLAGGAIAPAATRNFDVTTVAFDSYAAQGGDASDCSGAGSAGSFAAAVINFTVVNPTSQGFVTAYPVGTTRPLAATLVHAPGALLSNTSIVRLDQGFNASEMSVYSSGGTHLVGDIVGYFAQPVATALQCVETADTITPGSGITPGGTRNEEAPACEVGYTQTATNCTTSSWLMPIVWIKNGTCSARNNDSINQYLRASRTCCRVPGR